jgi:hypothetical protein
MVAEVAFTTGEVRPVGKVPQAGITGRVTVPTKPLSFPDTSDVKSMVRLFDTLEDENAPGALDPAHPLPE